MSDPAAKDPGTPPGAPDPIAELVAAGWTRTADGSLLPPGADPAARTVTGTPPPGGPAAPPPDAAAIDAAAALVGGMVVHRYDDAFDGPSEQWGIVVDQIHAEDTGAPTANVRVAWFAGISGPMSADQLEEHKPS